MAAVNDPNPKFLDVEKTYVDYLPKASVGWRITDEHMIYALASRGYRSTTPNVQVNLGVGPPLLEPDFLWNYELGLKTRWLDGLLVANVSGYRIDWKNLQASRVAEGRLGPLPVDVIYIDNIGDARIYGAEAESSLLLGEGFTVGLTGGYQDGRLVRQDPGSVAIPDSRVPNSPRWTGAVSGRYTTSPFGGLTLSAATSLQYVDDQASVEVTAKDPTGSETAAYRKLAAQVALDGERWGIALWGENLIDERIELQNASLVETEHFTTIGRPRTIGFSLRVSFGF
jgi:outer membrane receptor protein involved in Fe transport